MAPSIAMLRRAFCGATLGWATALPAATYLASRPAPSTVLYACTVVVYGIGSAVCHQLTERSFHIWGRQMPVCARCTGIYLGAALAVIFFGARRLRAEGASACLAEARTKVRRAEAGRLQPSVRRSPKGFALHGSRALLLAAALPTAATLLFEWTTGVMPANWIRAAAGAVIGAAVASVIIYEVN